MGIHLVKQGSIATYYSHKFKNSNAICLTLRRHSRMKIGLFLMTKYGVELHSNLHLFHGHRTPQSSDEPGCDQEHQKTDTASE